MKKEIILRWLKKAEDDLRVVKHLLEIDNVPTSAVCFHCQQAVEKYFKAYLTNFDIRVKKIHDMEGIFDLCIQQDKDFESFNRDKISRLTFYAVEVRYPDEFYIPSVNEAKECFEIASNVKIFVLKKLDIKNETF